MTWVAENEVKLYYRHMRAVLKSPILQKVYIYYGDDGNPDPKVKIGIDISKGSESSGNESAPSASNERITNSFDLESDRVTKKALRKSGVLLFFVFTCFSAVLIFLSRTLYNCRNCRFFLRHP